MKKLILSLLTGSMIVGFLNSAMAQVTVSATATATATIVTSISISKTVDMNFGNVARGAGGGSVVLSPAGVRTPTGTVQLAATNPGTVTAAAFSVAGQGAYTYAITVPSSDLTLTRVGGTETMTVNTFTATTTNTIGGSSPNYTSLLASGADAIQVGATLTVAADQAAGVYTNASSFVTVTINYN